ncbi:MAG: hypothetical protein SF051_04465 [Elusimicrobiota bacterium]|nr:hypothetical protein [Elusimicrobiota bacterium]
MDFKKDVMAVPQKKTPVWPYMLAGIAFGSALGVLLAPESGEQTREKIGRWIKDRREGRKTGFFARSHRKHQPMREEQLAEV